MDAVKHYEFAASEDFLSNLQDNAGFASWWQYNVCRW
jgi:hypothetical protein